MGPYPADPLFDVLNRLALYRRAHPDVIVTRPADNLSGLWEVSMPGASAMAFDSVERLVDVLESTERVTR